MNIIFIITILLAIVLVVFFIKDDNINKKLTKCRYCNKSINKGGVYIAGIGCGFCKSCRNDILKNINP